MSDLRRSQARLIASFHILHQHNIFDEGGTISMRHPSNPATFFASDCSPCLVSSVDALTEWSVGDAVPVRAVLGDQAVVLQSPYSAEVYIHSCIYARYSGVHSIVHTTAADMVVYGLCDSSGSMLRSAFNQAGFVNSYSPIFNPADHRSRIPTDHPQNLKIDHPELGAALAESLAGSTNGRRGFAGAGAGTADDGEERKVLPQHSVVLIRGNGAVIWSESLEDAVGRAVNLRRNAAIQTAAMLQRSHLDIGITYLSIAEARSCQQLGGELIESRWTTWATQTSRSPLYVNAMEEFVI